MLQYRVFAHECGQLSHVKRIIMQLFFAIAYLVAEYMRPQSIYDSLSSIPFAYLSILGLGISFLFSKRESLTSNPLNVLLVMYLFWFLVSYVFAFNQAAAWQPMLDFTKWVVIYFLLINTIQDERKLYIFLFVLLLLYFKLTQFAVRVWVDSGFYSDPRGLNAGGGIGSGFFRNPNDFGIALNSLFGISYYLAWFDDKKIGRFQIRWFHAIGSFFFVIAIISSSSRGAMIGLAVAMVIIWWRSTKRVLGIVLITVIGFAVIAVIPADNWERFQNMGSSEDATSQSRYMLWTSAVRMLNEYPITGVGPNNFTYVNVQHYHSDLAEVQHNVFLQAGSELGYPGLLLLLGMMAAYFVNQKKVREKLVKSNYTKSYLYGLSHGLDICMIGFMVNGFFITVLYYPFFWMLLILSASLRKAVENRIKEAEARA
jgi:putative inorganic carbon (hco3(-)) transporter